MVLVNRPWKRPQWPSHVEPHPPPPALGTGADVSALHPHLGCPAEQGPWSQSQSVSFYSLTGSSWRARPHPLPAQALPLSSPLWTEPSGSSCLPGTDPADMGTVGATQLCWAILSFLLLQGHNCQLTPQPSYPQGDSPSSEPSSPRPPSSARTPAVPEKTSQVPIVASKPTSPRSRAVDDQTPSLLDLTQLQPQQHTSGLDTSQNVTPKSATMSLRTREDSTVLPSPTSETVLTVAAFGVISFIVILVVVVIVLVSVVSLRFKCQKNKESEDPQKPGSSGLSESCSTANGEKDSITLISMKNINMNNSKGSPSAEKVL
ncbi:endothelial cell-specific chemotaxis regulator [Rhinolophus ferrumequinum]|nr:endothelial cell-specific chemotaxis regulator [Rhinolophus ferrumequinum]